MIHSALPKSGPGSNKTIQKKHISIITPEKILLNEKLMLTVMLTGVAMVLITWAIRKGK